MIYDQFGSGEWLKSLISPFIYQLAMPDATIPDAIWKDVHDTKELAEAWQRMQEIPEDFRYRLLMLAERHVGMSSGVRFTASMAGVDGAIVMTRDLKLIGFGAKINVEQDSKAIVLVSKPDMPDPVRLPLEDLGGTRHQSAARFVSANRDAVTIVVSQDGYVSVMHWEESTESVSVVRNAEWLM
jgi:hypothetical protein